MEKALKKTIRSPSLDISAEERLSWLRLSRSRNVDPITFYELLKRFGSATAALEQIPALAQI